MSFRLRSKDRYQWETLITARVPANPSKDEEYIWKDGPHFLLQGVEQWKSEVHNAVSRLAREGEPIETLISSHLLHTAAGTKKIYCDKIPIANFKFSNLIFLINLNSQYPSFYCKKNLITNLTNIFTTHFTVLTVMFQDLIGPLVVKSLV